MGNSLACHVDSILNVFDEKQESTNKETDKNYKKQNLLLSVSSSNSDTSKTDDSSSRRYYKEEPDCVSSILSDFSESIDNKNNFVNFDKSDRTEIYGTWNNNNNEVTTTENNDTILSDIDKNQRGGRSHYIKNHNTLHKRSEMKNNNINLSG